MALVFDIKRFATHDGPGIRTTVFLKGCPLRCPWCHNPEGISPTPQRMFTQSKCIKCGDCGTLCPTGALQTAGKEMPVEHIINICARERDTVEASGGGVTISGGEPLMSHDYCFALLDAIGSQLGFHRAVDTTLYAPSHIVDETMRRCELLLVDIKHSQAEVHKRLTGVSNELIIANLRRVAQAAHPFWARIPLIEGVNADDDNLRATATLLASLPTKPEVVSLLPYHELGRSKRQRMGMTYNPRRIPMSAPSQERKEQALNIFADAGLNAKIGG